MDNEERVACMDAWEHALSRIALGNPKWNGLRRRWGFHLLKQKLGILIPTIMEAYKIAGDCGYRGAFAEDFIPLFLENFTDDQCEIVPSWRKHIKTNRMWLIKGK